MALGSVGIMVLCLIVVHAATSNMGTRKKPSTLSDFAAMFKDQLSATLNPINVNLSTTLAGKVFQPSTSDIIPTFRDAVTNDTKQKLILVKNLTCPDGTKVFDIDNVTINEILQVAMDLQPLLNSPSETPPTPTGTPPTRSTTPPGQTTEMPLRTKNGDLNFLPLVCLKSNATLLVQENSTEDAKRQVLNPKLFALLTNEAASRALAALPASFMDMLCTNLIRTSTDNLLRITRRFPCDRQMLSLAQSDPVVAEALLQKTKERIGNLTEGEWKTLIHDFGSKIPRDILQKIPPQILSKEFVSVWAPETADLLLPKVNTSAIDTIFSISLCDLPLSFLKSIPSASLLAKNDSLMCLGKGKSASLKRQMAERIVPTPNITICKQYLQTFDPLDERCWQVMNESKYIREVGFSALSTVEGKMPCGLVRKLKDRLGLGLPSNWSQSDLEQFPWLLGCISTNDLTPEMISKLRELIFDGQLPDLQLSPSTARKLFSEIKANLSLDILMNMPWVYGVLTPSDVNQLSESALSSLLSTSAGLLRMMTKPTRQSLLSKLKTSGIRTLLCDLGEMAKDVGVETLMSITDLSSLLMNDSCHFQCQTKEQCAVVYSRIISGVDFKSWNNITRQMLGFLRDSRAICGMTLDDVRKLQPDRSLIDVAAAYFNAECQDPTKNQMFADKVSLYMKFSAQRNFTISEVRQLGGAFFKQMSAFELEGYSDEMKRDILLAIGRTELFDVDWEWIKEMTVLAIRMFIKDETGDINSTTIQRLGSLVCGLGNTHIGRMTPSVFLDAAPALGSCPDLSPSLLSALRVKMDAALNLNEEQMDAANLSLGGILMFADCSNSSYLDKIPNKTKHDTMQDMANAVNQWLLVRGTRDRMWKDASPMSESDRQAVKGNLLCGLKKMLVGYKAVNSNGSSTARKKRSTSVYSCDDIRLFGEQAVILTTDEITAISDFEQCIDVLGGVSQWSVEQKLALATKVKQIWGQPSSWTTDKIINSGTVLQGLSVTELFALNLTLDSLAAMGQLSGWTAGQLAAGFSKWVNTTAGVASMNNTTLQKLGRFACGATPQQISSISPESYKGAMSAIGDLDSCSTEQLKAWANLAVLALGPVTSWTLAQSAAVDRVLAGLNGSQLSLLSPDQLSVMDFDTFAAISPDAFASLNVTQLQSLSNQQVRSVTDAQIKSMSTAQKQILQDLGALVQIQGGGSPKLTVGNPVLVIMATIVMLVVTG